jgi:DNA-binding SARP family transcriptional activator
MRYRILGALEIRHDDGRLVQLAGPRPEKTVAALLLEANRVVPVQRLVDVLWDDDPPESAIKQARNCVSMIRAALRDPGAGPELSAPVSTSGAGYRLAARDGDLDALAFRALLAEAARQVKQGALDPAAGKLRAGLALWRGPVLTGLRSDALQPAAAHLTEQRLHALDQLAEVELRLGRPEQLVGPLTEIVAEYPLRERFVAHLMLALYRSGRRADALAAYRQLYARLDADLGIGPGGPVAGLHDQMLRADPALLDVPVPGPAAPAAAGARPAPAPRQLPAAARHFTGRDRELRQLDELLRESSGGGSAVVISAIEGTAGIGKTALAVYWAHRVAAEFPDGQLYVDLRGYAPAGPMDPAEALARFLRALGVAGNQVPGDAAESAAMFRSLLAARRMLLVLDNALDADQVRPLLPGSPGCLAVVTSRDRLAGLSVTHGAARMTVDVLPASESGRLLARLLGDDRVRAEAGPAAELARLCAHLPLALRIAAANLADRPAASIASYVTELETSDRLTALQVPDDPASTVRATLWMSCDRLSPAALRMFRLFSVHPGPDASRAALAGLAGQPLAKANLTTDALLRAHLLAEHTPGRLSWHDLLRLCAGELAAADEAAAARDAAGRRMFGHYLHSAYLADRQLDPSRTPIDLAPAQPGTTPESPAGEEQALAWFEAERLALVDVVSQAAAAGCDAEAWQLAWSMLPFLERRGYWPDMVRTQRAGLAAAERLGDPTGAARMHRCLATALAVTGALDEAETHLRQSLGIACRLGEPAMQGDAHLNLGWVLAKALNYEQAIRHASAALGRFRAAQHRGSEARALNNLGWYHMHLGHHEAAANYCEQALQILRADGDRYSEALVQDSLGCIYRHLGRPADAVDCLQAALGTYRALGDRYLEALALSHLGDVHSHGGGAAAAGGAWRQSLAIFEDLDHPEAGQVRSKLVAAGLA